MLEELTIVVVTYQRYNFLKRLLKFYVSYESEVRLLVLDSSSDYLEDEELKDLLTRDQVNWVRYDPTIFFSSKISQGCKHINTKYAVLCADDDFLIPKALKACTEFLTDHPDYSSALGFDFDHSRGPDVRNDYFRILPLTKGKSSEENTALERVQSYLSGKTGSYPFYAVHRTSTFCKMWKQTTKYVSDWGLSELFPCSLSFALGKMKLLPVFYMSREPNSFAWCDDTRFNEMYTEEKMVRVVKGLSKYLSKEDGLSIDVAERFSRDAFASYLNRARNKRQLNSIKDTPFSQFFKKVKHKIRIRTRVFGLIYYFLYNGCHPSIYPEYLEDFKRIKNAVLSSNLTAQELNESRKDYAKQGKLNVN